ncbi:class I SAM-dependent methyltransferase [Sagittula sp. NFXS13]|uniref:S-adenosylmethionine-diacylgycerolhomoserine-N-methyltransferase n=1 Tax=Sagittula marina TaxID=943940 RepID=A0A7W6DNW2_9RHOB|nr:class I SAM-dependent methyltransferase [Sagittula marina]MBB3984162.1 S-adenosylmethionine-diacylgycerolhomoserine-N-methyltransferase [Sagittula marina]
MSHIADHGQLMDNTYRTQRLFYDATRKYYLLGRDHLLDQMQVSPDDRILEVACGTGRNLAVMKQRHPHARLYGLDISQQMLRSARRKLGLKARLARADACAFDPQTLFDVPSFDHIVFSYSLSMIPDWQGALDEAARHLAPGGTLHIIDFGDQGALPRWTKRGLRAWLARFHVTPRDALPIALQNLPRHGGVLLQDGLFRRYAYYARLERRT